MRRKLKNRVAAQTARYNNFFFSLSLYLSLFIFRYISISLHFLFLPPLSISLSNSHILSLYCPLYVYVHIIENLLYISIISACNYLASPSSSSFPPCQHFFSFFSDCHRFDLVSGEENKKEFEFLEISTGPDDHQGAKISRAEYHEFCH